MHSMPPRTKQSTIALAVLIILCGLYVIGSSAQKDSSGLGFSESKIELATVETIKETGNASSTFITDAYVIGKYDCAACPAGHDCRPCPAKDSAVIIDSAGPSSPETPMLSSQMVVYSDAGKYLRLGGRYRFKLFLEPGNGTSTNNILRAKIVGYQLIGQ